jgi:hypothetical protein
MKPEKHDLYAQIVRKLQINGKSERTVQAYTRAIHQLTKHYQGRTPCVYHAFTKQSQRFRASIFPGQVNNSNA